MNCKGKVKYLSIIQCRIFLLISGRGYAVNSMKFQNSYNVTSDARYIIKSIVNFFVKGLKTCLYYLKRRFPDLMIIFMVHTCTYVNKCLLSSKS